MKELDVVALVVDMPEHGLRAGQRGTIVAEHSNPTAYEVEFSDDDGVDIAQLALKPDQIRVTWSFNEDG